MRQTPTLLVCHEMMTDKGFRQSQLIVINIQTDRQALSGNYASFSISNNHALPHPPAADVDSDPATDDTRMHDLCGQFYGRALGK